MKKSFQVFLIIFLSNSAQAAAVLPQGYDRLSACAKQEVLWQNIEASRHDKLPPLSEFGVREALAMSVQAISKKKNHLSDAAPKNWTKYLHQRGVVSKVKFVATKKSQFTGLFKGADCGLLRLSVTYQPTEKRDFAPGLALKLLRDAKAPSSNVSALYALEGQGKNYNFFKNPLSNIVPIGTDPGLKFVHYIFKKVTDYPEQLLLADFSTVDAKGNTISKAMYPRQIFFVPDASVSNRFSEDEHEFREDILKIKKGTRLYKVYALSGRSKFDYADYELNMIEDFAKSSVHIGDLVTTSSFVASEFGDNGIFFRHETVPKKPKQN